MDNIDEFLVYRHGYPRPDWERISGWVDGLPEGLDRHHIWTEIQAKWLGRLADHLQDNYSIWESVNFLVVCNHPKSSCERLVRFCEKSRTQIRKLLGNAFADEGWGKIVVLILSSSDDYFDYIGDWYPDEGEFGGSSGMCLSGACPHLVVLAGPTLPCDAIIAHELNHYFLQHLDLPMWLNEGITQVVEEEIAGQGKPERDRELSRKHALWWNSNTIQEFWSGQSFSTPDDRQLLSYDLAMQMATRLLSRFPATFAEFLTMATSADAGDAGLWKTCHNSLNQCVSEILGNQDWSPQLPSGENSSTMSGPLACTRHAAGRQPLQTTVSSIRFVHFTA